MRVLPAGHLVKSITTRNIRTQKRQTRTSLKKWGPQNRDIEETSRKPCLWAQNSWRKMSLKVRSPANTEIETPLRGVSCSRQEGKTKTTNMQHRWKNEAVTKRGRHNMGQMWAQNQTDVIMRNVVCSSSCRHDPRQQTANHDHARQSAATDNPLQWNVTNVCMKNELTTATKKLAMWHCIALQVLDNPIKIANRRRCEHTTNQQEQIPSLHKTMKLKMKLKKQRRVGRSGPFRLLGS